MEVPARTHFEREHPQVSVMIEIGLRRIRVLSACKAETINTTGFIVPSLWLTKNPDLSTIFRDGDCGMCRPRSWSVGAGVKPPLVLKEYVTEGSAYGTCPKSDCRSRTLSGLYRNVSLLYPDYNRLSLSSLNRRGRTY